MVFVKFMTFVLGTECFWQKLSHASQQTSNYSLSNCLYFQFSYTFNYPSTFSPWKRKAFSTFHDAAFMEKLLGWKVDEENAPRYRFSGSCHSQRLALECKRLFTGASSKIGEKLRLSESKGKRTKVQQLSFGSIKRRIPHGKRKMDNWLMLHNRQVWIND